MTLRSYLPMKRIGKRAFVPADKPLPPGHCTWCGHRFVKLDRDHVLPRSVFPGAQRDAPPNIVPACRGCNRARADGKLRPSFDRLPRRSQVFTLRWMSAGRLDRYFMNVPRESGEQGTPIG